MTKVELHDLIEALPEDRIELAAWVMQLTPEQWRQLEGLLETPEAVADLTTPGRAYHGLMTSAAPDPFDEDLARVLADDKLMAHVDELHRKLKAGELETHTHEEVLQGLRRFRIRPPLADQVVDEPGR